MLPSKSQGGDMSESTHGATPDPAPPVPPRWKGINSLDLVHQLNERCFELLCDLAAADTRHTDLPLLADNREIWIRVEPEARHRAARMPFVVVDAKFSDEAWWRHAAASRARVAGAEAFSNGLPHEASEQLMHEVIMFAWQTARWDRTVAQLSLGMTPSVADIVAALTPQKVREIAARESHAVEIRWANNPVFWRDVLVAASEGSNERMAELHLHAKLLLCGELAKLEP
jgi:hypothetical protein